MKNNGTICPGTISVSIKFAGNSMYHTFHSEYQGQGALLSFHNSKF